MINYMMIKKKIVYVFLVIMIRIILIFSYSINLIQMIKRNLLFIKYKIKSYLLSEIDFTDVINNVKTDCSNSFLISTLYIITTEEIIDDLDLNSNNITVIYVRIDESTFYASREIFSESYFVTIYYNLLNNRHNHLLHEYMNKWISLFQGNFNESEYFYNNTILLKNIYINIYNLLLGFRENDDSISTPKGDFLMDEFFSAYNYIYILYFKDMEYELIYQSTLPVRNMIITSYISFF